MKTQAIWSPTYLTSKSKVTSYIPRGIVKFDATFRVLDGVLLSCSLYFMVVTIANAK